MTEPPEYGWVPEHPVTTPPAYGPPPADPPAVQHGAWEVLGEDTEPAPRRRFGRGRLLAAVGVVAALTAGGVVTAIAVSDSGQPGASSPQGAIRKIVGDINASDLAGMLDDLAPAERTAIADPILAAIADLKRSNVLRSDADPNSVDAVHASITRLTFGATIPVNDHVQIVQVTGGSITVATDLSKIPFTKDLVNALFPHGQPTGRSTQAVDIARSVQDNGGKPLRFAAEKVNGRWYPSLIYTIVDAAVHGAVPAASQRIAAAGATSPEGAVRTLVDAALRGDLAKVVALTAPDELAAVHDYGHLLLGDIGTNIAPVPVQLDDLQLTPTSSTGNAQRLVLKRLALVTRDGSHVNIEVSGTCATVTVDNDQQRICASQSSAQIDSLFENLTGRPLTPQQRTAVAHLFGSTTQVGGIVTITSGGKWFVAPVRTVFEAVTSLLSRLQGDDLLVLIRMFAGLGR